MALGLEQARALHDEVPVIDLHADTPKLMHALGYDLAARHRRPLPRFANYVGHVDLPRMRDGGVSGQIFGLWTFPYPQRGCAASVHRQLDALDAAIAERGDEIAWAASGDDVRAARAGGSIAALAGIEGGQALEGKLDNVAAFAARRVRYLGLVHLTRNALASPMKRLGEDADAGLTGFGRDVVREMNRVGMIVDLAHLNRRGFFEALALCERPPMVSHTGVTGVHAHWRNIDDEQIRAVADAGGCVGIIFAAGYLGGRGVDAICDHILHVIDVAGEDVPALGSDFDGFVVPPPELDDVSKLPRLTAALSARGLPVRVLEKILGENALRVLGRAPAA